MTDPKTSVMSYATSGGLVLFGTALNDWALIIGMFCAIATFLLNWYYKHQHLQVTRKVAEVQLEGDEL